MVRGEDHRSRSTRSLLAGRAGLVRGELRGADRGPDPRLGGHRPGRAHAHPRPDRQRQDARRLPLRPRSPRPGPSPEPTRADPGHVRVLYVSPLKALTYDVERNLRAPLTGIGLAAAEARRRAAEDHRRAAAPATRRPRTVGEIARHPPDILITTPESLYLLLTSQAREILRTVEHVIVDEVHAIAGTKRGAHLALTLERLERLRDADGTPAAAHRPVRHAAAARHDRPLPRRHRTGPRGDDRRRRHAQAARARGRRPGRRHGRARRGPAAGAAARRPGDQPRGRGRSIWPAIHPRILELDPLAQEHDRVHQQPSPQRAARPAPQRAGRRGPRPRPPRQHRPRAAPRDRGGAQGRTTPGPGRHELAGARHRHGRGRPRDPGREPDQRRPRPAARRSCRPPGRCPEQGRHLPEVPRRPARGRGRHAPHARGRDRADAHPAQPARRPRPAARRDDRHGSLDRRRPVPDRHPRRAVRDAHARGVRRRPRHARRRLPVATSSPSSSRASSGTA